MAHDLGLTADHEAVSALETAYAAAGAAIHVMHSALGKALCSNDVVAIVGVATIDDDVAFVEPGHERVERGIDDGSGHHQPDGSRLRETRDELLELDRSCCAFLRERLHGSRGSVVNDAAVSVTHQTPHHVGAHAPQPDHPQLHVILTESRTRSCFTARAPLTRRA